MRIDALAAILDEEEGPDRLTHIMIVGAYPPQQRVSIDRSAALSTYWRRSGCGGRCQAPSRGAGAAGVGRSGEFQQLQRRSDAKEGADEINANQCNGHGEQAIRNRHRRQFGMAGRSHWLSVRRKVATTRRFAMIT